MGCRLYEKCDAYVIGFCFLKMGNCNAMDDCPVKDGARPQELHKRIRKFVTHLNKKKWAVGLKDNTEENLIEHRVVSDILESAVKILIHGIDARRNLGRKRT